MFWLAHVMCLWEVYRAFRSAGRRIWINYNIYIGKITLYLQLKLTPKINCKRRKHDCNIKWPKLSG